ncbi:hypothetical protein FPZ49_32915 [Paenibacillus cremeus]|uniref:Uncharacterized protein n=2 Tax=Paenibacillus cremeus TaxID=2163881 RepID=A0A559JMA1_9BACL|nr:hypothetical protein FPZ49_32915 [Paenibacillus cremeus]
MQQLREGKRKRIAVTKSPGHVDKILRTEEKWGELSIKAHTRREICLSNELLDYDLVRRLIHGAAHRWARAYRDKRITFEDFLSSFYEAAWRVIERYTWATDFYLFETISNAIKRRGQSMLRAAGNDKRRAFHEALPLADDF